MADLTREQIERHIAAWTWPVQGEADVIMPIQTALALAHMALRSLSGSGVKEQRDADLTGALSEKSTDTTNRDAQEKT